MAHIDEVRCDICGEVVERKNIKNRIWLNEAGSRYHLEVWNPKGRAKMTFGGSNPAAIDWDLCPKCYKLIQKSIKDVVKKVKTCKK